MASLSTKVKLYCAANSKTVDFTTDVLLQDDSNGKGPYIKAWNISGLAQPTDEQLATYETAGNTEETNNTCLLYTSPSPRDGLLSRMPSSA